MKLKGTPGSNQNVLAASGGLICLFRILLRSLLFRSPTSTPAALPRSPVSVRALWKNSGCQGEVFRSSRRAAWSSMRWRIVLTRRLPPTWRFAAHREAGGFSRGSRSNPLSQQDEGVLGIPALPQASPATGRRGNHECGLGSGDQGNRTGLCPLASKTMMACPRSRCGPDPPTHLQPEERAIPVRSLARQAVRCYRKLMSVNLRRRSFAR